MGTKICYPGDLTEAIHTNYDELVFNSKQRLSTGGATNGYVDIGNTETQVGWNVEQPLQDSMDDLWGSGNTIVTSVGSDTYDIEFIGTYAGIHVPTMDIVGHSTDGNPVISVITFAGDNNFFIVGSLRFGTRLYGTEFSRYVSCIRFLIDDFDLTNKSLDTATITFTPSSAGMTGEAFKDLISVDVGAVRHASDINFPTDRDGVLFSLEGGSTWIPDEDLPLLHGTSIDVPVTSITNTALASLVSGEKIMYYLTSTGPDQLQSYFSLAVNSSYKPQLVLVYTDLIPGHDLGGIQVVSDVSVVQSVIVAVTRRKDVESELTVEQDISITRTRSREVTSIVDVEQSIHVAQIVHFEIEDFLPITQTIQYSHAHVRSVESVLEIIQTIDVDADFRRYVNSDVEVIQEISVSRDRIYTVYSDVDVEQTINVTPIQLSVTHYLTPVQSIEVETVLQQPLSVISDVEVEQDIFVNKVYNRTVESELTVKHFFVVYKGYTPATIPTSPLEPNVGGPVGGGGDGGASEEDEPGEAWTRPDLIYNPSVGGGDSDEPIIFPTVPSATPCGLPTTGEMTLEYPVDTPEVTYTIRQPLFSNKEELQITRIQRETIHGDLKTYVNSSWPKIRTLRYKFEGLTADERDSFYDFLLLTLGQKVILTDYEDRVWHGYIITPTPESTDLGECDKTLEFDFIGEPGGD